MVPSGRGYGLTVPHPEYPRRTPSPTPGSSPSPGTDDSPTPRPPDRVSVVEGGRSPVATLHPRPRRGTMSTPSLSGSVERFQLVIVPRLGPKPVQTYCGLYIRVGVVTRTRPGGVRLPRRQRTGGRPTDRETCALPSHSGTQGGVSSDVGAGKSVCPDFGSSVRTLRGRSPLADSMTGLRPFGERTDPESQG